MLDPHILRNASEIREIIEKAGNVIGVFQGHYHPGLYIEINGIPYIGISAMVDGQGYESNAFAVVSIYNEAIIIEGFGRQQSLTIPINL